MLSQTVAGCSWVDDDCNDIGQGYNDVPALLSEHTVSLGEADLRQVINGVEVIEMLHRGKPAMSLNATAGLAYRQDIFHHDDKGRKTKCW